MVSHCKVMKVANLGINKNKMVKPRVHNQHHVAWLKKPKHAKKDLATPTTPLFSSVKRAGMRRLRVRNGTSAKVPKAIHNSATRAALRASLEQHGCPDGVTSPAWASHSAKKCKLLSGETSWASILKRFNSAEGHISQKWCPCCGAPGRKDDWCGASLIPDVNMTQLRSTIKYILHPQNLIGSHLDPQDQQELQRSFLIFAEVPCVSAGASEVKQLRIAARVCLYLSMVACPSSATYVSAALLKRSKPALEAAIATVPVGELFRGGQRPLWGGRNALASAVLDFDTSYGLAIANLLLKLKYSRSQEATNRFAYDLVEIVTSQDAVVGFAEYRAKRYLEILVLAGSCKFGSIRLMESDLDAAWSIWPVPGNTATGLRCFAPTACNDVLLRQALRLLARLLRHMGSKVTLCRLSALVCFERKERSGVMSLTKPA